MKIKYLIILPALTIFLAGCGSSYNETSANYINDFAQEKAVSYDMTESASVDDYEMPESANENLSQADIVKETAMIIKNARISVNVEELEDFNTNLTEKIDTFGGYIENSEIEGFTSEYDTTRTSYYTVRIPQKNLDAFLEGIKSYSNITSKSIDTQDVSLEYIDVKAHIKALEDEKTKLESLLDSAETLSDVLDIQDRISNIQYQLDSQNSQKKYLENKVSYSTVNITATQERTIKNSIGKFTDINFGDKIYGGFITALSIIVGIISALPAIIVVTTFGIAFITIVIKIFQKIFKKKK